MTSFAPKTVVTKLSANITMLHDMLTMMRPNGSKTEQRFIDKYLIPIGCAPDGAGNLHLRIGDAPVLWSSHVDTVHHHGGFHPIRVNAETGIIDVHPKSEANCLGADDTAGVWVMVNMILEKRPGLYVFHRGEECGGIGSKWIAKEAPDLLKGIKYAIALDRRGKDSIITHQWGGRCCSEVFSKSLEAELGMGLKSDSGGSFTDTASYVGLVGECTNLSVGYTAQHSRMEDLDQNFLSWLLERLLVLDWDNLTDARKPGDKEAKSYNNGTGYGGYWNGHGGGPRHDKRGSKRGKNSTPPIFRWRGSRLEEETIQALVEDYPEEVSKMLAESNYDIEFLRRGIRRHGGVIPDDMPGGVH